jgi:hypothetical protein
MSLHIVETNILSLKVNGKAAGPHVQALRSLSLNMWDETVKQTFTHYDEGTVPKRNRTFIVHLIA